MTVYADLAELEAAMLRAIEALDEAARLARRIADDELLVRVARRLENAGAQAELDRRSLVQARRPIDDEL